MVKDDSYSGPRPPKGCGMEAWPQEVKRKEGHFHSRTSRVRPSGLSLKVVLPESPDSVGCCGETTAAALMAAHSLKILFPSKHSL